MTGRAAVERLFDNERVDALLAVLGEANGRRLFATFADGLPVETRALATIAAQGDLAATARQAHSLKGAAANFGAARLQAVARKVELAARNPPPPRGFNAMIAELERVARTTGAAARRI